MQRLAIFMVLMVIPVVSVSADTQIPTVQGITIRTAGDGVNATGALRFDGFVLSFSENVQASHLQADDFVFSGCLCSGFSVVVGRGPQLVLGFDAENVTQAPSLAYAPQAGRIHDAAGNDLAPFADRPAADDLGPRITRLIADGSGHRRLTVEWSEGVWWAGDSSSGLVPADLVVAGREVVAVRHVAGESAMEIEISPPWAPRDEGVLTLAPAQQRVAGASALALPVPVRAVSDPVAPGAVSNLEVVQGSVGHSSLTLGWQTPVEDDLAVFEVRFGVGVFNASVLEAGQRVAGVPAPEPGEAAQVIVRGLASQEHHWLAVRVVDRNDNPSPWEAVTATTLADEAPPAAVGNLTALPIGVRATSLTWQWTAPADDEGGNIARYEIRLRPGGIDATNVYSQASEAIGALVPKAPDAIQSLVTEGLEPGVLYGLAIRAFDAAGNAGPWSYATGTTGTDTTPPEGALVLRSETHADGQWSNLRKVGLDWDSVEDPEGPATFHLRVSQLATDAATWRDPVATSPTNITLDHDGEWYIHLSAVSQGGELHAEPLRVQLDTVAPAAVSGLHVSEEAIHSVLLGWRAHTDASRVEVHSTSERSDTTLLVSAPGNATGVRVQDLEANITHELHVFAIDAAGNVGPASRVTATPLADPTPPNGVIQITAESHPGGSGYGRTVRLSWSAAHDPDSSVVYHIGVGEVPTDVDQSTTRTDLDLDLPLGTYEIHVRARSAGGWGPQASLMIQVRDVPAAAGAALDINVERQAGGNRITWTIPEDAAGVQVWVSNSPLAYVTGLGTKDAEFQHEGPDARTGSRYVVTAFYGREETLGWYDPDEPPEVLAAQAKAPSGTTNWLAWSLLGLAGLAVVVGGALTVRVVMRRRATAPVADPLPAVEEDLAEPAMEGYGEDTWDANDEPPEPVMEVELLTACHACGEAFQVSGVPPVAAECPQCDAACVVEV